ncbi:baculoviral IAP repeat-containing protein 1g-like isoform X2 [Liolophura sinensis]|uniref:baculoviral IAP repeat-containing protein 1g-like isoform X2 n=1 Tax=Liolophura sinensis TaxID=3198878 RepID=UPI003158BAE1
MCLQKPYQPTTLMVSKALRGFFCMVMCLDTLSRKPDTIIQMFFMTLEKADKVLYSQLVWPVPSESDVKEVTSKTEVHQQTNLSLTQTELAEWYKRVLSKLQPLPWCKWFQVNLDQVFTNLTIVPSLKHRLSIESEEKLRHGEPDTMKFLTKFLWSSNKRTVAFVEGPAGFGKTTLCRHLAYVWATSNKAICDRTFDLVFILEARALFGDFKDCVLKQLFPDDFKLDGDDIFSCITGVDKDCLFIIDGVDELTGNGKDVILKILGGNSLRRCNILLTGRPEVSGEFIELVDKHLKIIGFSTKETQFYIKKYFEGRSVGLRDKLLQSLDTNKRLRELAVNPFTAMLLCVLAEEKDGAIPLHHTDVLKEVILTTCKRYVHKLQKSSSGEDKTSFTVNELLEAAGNLAYKGFTMNSLVFPEEYVQTFCGADLGRHVLNSGLLYRDFTVSRLHSVGYCYFPHKSIQEFLCAHHLRNINPSDLQQKLQSLPPNYHTSRGVFRVLFDMFETPTPALKALLLHFLQCLFTIKNQAHEFRLHVGLGDLAEANTKVNLLDVSAEIIGKTDSLHKQMCKHLVSNIDHQKTQPSSYSYLEQKVLQKDTFKPIVVAVDLKLQRDPRKSHMCPNSCVGRPNSVERTVDGLHLKASVCVPYFREKVLHYYEHRFRRYPGLTLPWVHCENINTANALVKDDITVDVVSVTLLPGIFTLKDLRTLLARRRTGGLFLLNLNHPHDDYLELNILSVMKSSKCRQLYVHRCSLQDSCQSHRSLVYSFQWSPQQLFYDRFCPY